MFIHIKITLRPKVAKLRND